MTIRHLLHRSNHANTDMCLWRKINILYHGNDTCTRIIILWDHDKV